MDYFTLRRHVAELAKALEDKPVLARATDVPGRSFSLRLKRRDGWNDLVISLDNPGQGLRLTVDCPESERSSSLVRTMNRLLTNGRLAGITLAGNESDGQYDRVVRLHFVVVDSFFGNRSDFYLFGEFTGRVADVFICDADMKILDRFARTSNNLIGGVYRLPESQSLLNPGTIDGRSASRILAAPPEEWKNQIGGLSPQFTSELAFRAVGLEDRPAKFAELYTESCSNQLISVYLKNGRFKTLSCFRLSYLSEKPDFEFASVNEAMNWLEDFQAGPHRFNEAKKRVLSALHSDLKQKNSLIEDQQALLQKFSGADHFQKLGNLLVASLYRVKPGSRTVEVEDWQTGENLTIELDTSKTPAANATRFFNLYKKARRGIIEVEKRIEALKGEIDWLREQLWLAENATAESDLPFEEKKANHYRSTPKNKKEQNSARKGRISGVKPAFEIEGCRFYVGRNAKQNDLLTFQVARRGDWWFHANDVPGAHVILKKPEGEINENDLWAGAVLASWFSFARESSKVAVDATEVSYVKRIPGGMPGRVSYTHQQTIMVNPGDALPWVSKNLAK
jgi:predicted ribosome quality control (RQC) complex YloA/Tae2 family protein